MTHPLINNNADLSTAISILDQWIDRTTFKHHQPGLAVGIIHDNELLWGKGYGYADVDSKTPVTLDHRFRIASVTKTFTSIAILQLRDAGKLRLDDPVSQYLDWYPYQFQDAPAVTIHNLLTHTGGLPRDAHKPLWTGLEAPTWDEVLAIIEQRQPTQPPYNKFAYSNLGYSLLGAIITQISGLSWADYLQQHILDPLGMTNTHPIPSADDPQLATGYSRMSDRYERDVLPFFLMNGFEASANFASSINDLTKYAAFHLGTASHPVLSAHSLRDMHRIHWLYDSWQGGYGLGTETYKVNDWSISGHSGGYPGYLTQFTVCREHNTGVIILTNAVDSNPRQYAEQTYKLVLPEIIKATATPSHADPSWEQYVGQYDDIWGLDSVVIRYGQLQIISVDTLEQPPAILEPTETPHTFIMRKHGQSNETVRFELDDDGKVTQMRFRNEIATRR